MCFLCRCGFTVNALLHLFSVEIACIVNVFELFGCVYESYHNEQYFDCVLVRDLLFSFIIVPFGTFSYLFLLENVRILEKWCLVF